MNKRDRKAVVALKARLETLKAELETIAGELDTLAEAEQGKFDNLSDGLQEAPAGQAIALAEEWLESAAQACWDGDVVEAVNALEMFDL